MKVKSLSCVRLLATPWTATYKAPLSMGFSRQEYWNGVPLPPPSFCHKGGVICLSEVIDISPGNLDSHLTLDLFQHQEKSWLLKKANELALHIKIMDQFYYIF